MRGAAANDHRPAKVSVDDTRGAVPVNASKRSRRQRRELAAAGQAAFLPAHFVDGEAAARQRAAQTRQVNPARSRFEHGRLRERQRILAPTFQRDDASSPGAGRRVARPASFQPGAELDVGIGGIAGGIDLRLVMRDRALDTGAQTACGDGVGAQRRRCQRKPQRTIGAGADLAFDGECRGGEFGVHAKAVAGRGERERRAVPCAGDLSVGAQAAGEPCIERGGISHVQREAEHVTGAAEIAVQAQLIRAGAQLHVRVANAAGRERQLPGAGKRPAAQAAVAAEIERKRGRPSGLERTLRACRARKRCDRIVAEARRIQRRRNRVHLECLGARKREGRRALQRAAASLCAERADVDDAVCDSGAEGECHVRLPQIAADLAVGVGVVESHPAGERTGEPSRLQVGHDAMEVQVAHRKLPVRDGAIDAGGAADAARVAESCIESVELHALAIGGEPRSQAHQRQASGRPRPRDGIARRQRAAHAAVISAGARERHLQFGARQRRVEAREIDVFDPELEVAQPARLERRDARGAGCARIVDASIARQRECRHVAADRHRRGCAPRRLAAGEVDAPFGGERRRRRNHEPAAHRAPFAVERQRVERVPVDRAGVMESEPSYSPAIRPAGDGKRRDVGAPHVDRPGQHQRRRRRARSGAGLELQRHGRGRQGIDDDTAGKERAR